MKNVHLCKLLLSILLILVLASSQVAFPNSYAAGRDKIPPSDPTNLIASNITENSMTLSWTKSTDNSGSVSYNVYMNGVLSNNSAITTYQAINLAPDTVYSFYVRAKDPTGNLSGPSNTIAPTTLEATPIPISAKRIVAYYTSWSAYGGFTPDKIAATKVTHINYAFANIGNDLKIALGDSTIDLKNFDKLNTLKKSYPHLKTLISVGGWSWSGKFSDVALCPASRDAFADSCVAFILQYGFDGVDIDWEYPVGGGLAGNAARPEDKQNFTLLLKALRDKLDAQSLKDSKSYLLTIAGAANQDFINNTELPTLAGNLDFANLMTYDMHGSWDKYTDFNAPLYIDQASPQLQISVDSAVQSWIHAGFPADKIVVGVPFYGRKYGAVKSTDPTKFGLYQTYGRCTTITYNEIMTSYTSSKGYLPHFNDITKVPWLFNGSTFISYDNATSILEKMKYINKIENNLGGAMVWELSQDNNNELINAVYSGLN